MTDLLDETKDTDGFMDVKWTVDVYDHMEDGWTRYAIEKFSQKQALMEGIPDGETHFVQIDLEHNYFKLLDCHESCSAVGRMLYDMVQRQFERGGDIVSTLAPPAERRFKIQSEIAVLDEQLKVAEEFGYTKIGIQSKPFALAIEKTLSNDLYPQYDTKGAGVYERLVRAHMRNIALTKLCEGTSHTAYAEAEVGLAKTYARMKLWKQVQFHGKKALRCMALVEKNSIQTGQIHLSKLQKNFNDISTLQKHMGMAKSTADFLSCIKSISSLPLAFRDLSQDNMLNSTVKSIQSDGKIHWTSFIEYMYQENTIFSTYIQSMEASLPLSIMTKLREMFPSSQHAISSQTLVERLANEDPLYWGDLHLDIVSWAAKLDTISWPELIERALTHAVYDERLLIRPEIRLLMGRYHTNQGQLTEALKYLNLAIVDQEQTFGQQHIKLVDYYLAKAEALVLLYQHRERKAQFSAENQVEEWLKTPEGIEALGQEQDRTTFVKKRAKYFYAAPSNETMEEATELYVRAWSLREAEYGKSHLEVANSFAALGNLYILKNDLVTAAGYLEKAIDTTNSNSILASMLRVHLGRLYQHIGKIKDAKQLFHQAGKFYYDCANHSSEFSTSRRAFASRAIEAWKYWLSVAVSSSELRSNEEKVRQLIVAACKRGFGDRSMEMAAALKSLSAFYAKQGEREPAKKHLTYACQTLEVHVGTNDKRYRRARQSLNQL